MISNYMTKTDINGNTYTLRIDHAARTYERGAWLVRSESVIITRRKMRELIDECKQNNYTEKTY